MMDASKYRVGYYPVGKEYNKWVEKDHVEWSHNPKVDSSSLSPATKTLIVTAIKVVAIFYCLKIGCNNAQKRPFYVELGKSWG